VREILRRIADRSELDEFKPLYGTQLVCGWATICGFAVGVLANNGILFSEEAQKGAQFIQLCNRSDTPLLFVQNITGFMVGTQYERGGIVKHGAQLINAVANSTVPHLTLMVGASSGAGNYGMSAGRTTPVRVHVAQPPDRRDGSQAAGRRLSIVQRTAAERAGRDYDEQADAEMRDAIEAQIEAESTRCSPPAGSGTTASSTLALPHGAGHRAVRRARRRSRGLVVQGVPAVSPGTVTKPMHTLLVANRGEIAVRVIEAAHELGLRTVAVYAEPDRNAPHAPGRVAVPLRGATAAETYLDQAQLLGAALAQGADAVHPGYGFLSEHAGSPLRSSSRPDVGRSPPRSHPLDGRQAGGQAHRSTVGVPTLPSAELTGEAEFEWRPGLDGRLPAPGEGGRRRWRAGHAPGGRRGRAGGRGAVGPA
jgi:hypothetical protein